MRKDIYDYDGTIQSRSAAIKKLRKIYSKTEEEQIYFVAIQMLSEAYPEIVTQADIEVLKSKGRLFLADYERSHRGEHYTKTDDISTNSPVVDGKIDETMLHEIIHKLTFLKGIITQEDFTKNAPYYEGATELTTQGSFGLAKQSRKILKGEKEYKVNLAEDVVYPEQVALLRQINLLLGGNFVEQSILQDKKALENEMSKKFGEHTYTMFFEKMSETMNARGDADSISKAIDTLQALILENCCTMKLEQARTEQDYLDFMEMLQTLGQMRLTNDENQAEFKHYYNLFYNITKVKFTQKGYDISKLEQYERFEYEEYSKSGTDKNIEASKEKEKARKKEDLIFENSVLFERISDKVMSGDVSDIDLYVSDLTEDNGLIATYIGGKLVGLTRLATDRWSTEIVKAHKEDYGAYVGVSGKVDSKDFTDKAVKSIYTVEKKKSFDSVFALEDYFIETEDEMLAILNTNGKRTALNLQKADEKLKAEILDGIRSRADMAQYFRKQKDELGKELGVTFCR